MIEQVLISGQLGMAIYKENGRYFATGVEGFDSPKECRPGDISTFLNCGAEFNIISKPDIDLHSIQRALEFQRQGHRTLSLIVSGFDDELGIESRLLSIEAAEELLQEQATYAFVRARILARLLPPASDINGAIACAKNSSCYVVMSLYREVVESQPIIQSILDAWREVAPKFFHSIEEQIEGEKALAEASVFADMIAAINSQDIKELDHIVVTYGLTSELNERFPQLIHVINAIKSRLYEDYASVKKSNKDREDEIPLSEHLEEPRNTKTISELITNYEHLKEAWKYYRPLAIHEIKDSIDRQIETIGKLICRGNFSHFDRYFRDLVEFHIEHQRKEYLAMSLCSLAKIATDAYEFEIAGVFVDYAFMLNIEDVVIWTTQAQILKKEERFDEALAIYNTTIERFPGHVWAHCGRASLLKDMGRFDEALTAYKYANERFPDDLTPLTGQAAVLKEMGRFDEALTVYSKAIKLSPLNMFANTGRAAVLKEMGRFNEALRAYEDAVFLSPDETLPRNRRAAALREMGYFKEAYTAYEETLEYSSEDAWARNGRAAVLKEMGLLNESLKAYEEILASFPGDVAAQIGYASVLKEMGEYPKALIACEQAMERFPDSRMARNSYASLLMLMDRFEEARSFLGEDRLISRGDWISYHIQAMSYLKSGDIEEALRRLTFGYENVPWREDKIYFATALGIAKMKTKAFAEAVIILQDNVINLDVFQKQKRLLFIGHAQAELGDRIEAANTLTSLMNTENWRVIKARDALFRRYNLGDKTDNRASEISITELDKEIYEEEFFLAMAA